MPGRSPSSNPVRAFVALGSNVGDRLAYLAYARERMGALPDSRIAAASRIYETAPVGPKPQGAYLNAVLALETMRPAGALLRDLLDIELEAGRRRDAGAARWGPRTLDLDLLLYGDLCLDEPGLEVPHPRLHERAFVLEPLCELAGELYHPRLGERMAEYAARCCDPGSAVLYRGDGAWPSGRPSREVADGHRRSEYLAGR